MARGDVFRNGQHVRVSVPDMKAFEGIVDNETDLMARGSNPLVRVRADGGWHEVYDKQYVTMVQPSPAPSDRLRGTRNHPLERVMAEQSGTSNEARQSHIYGRNGAVWTMGQEVVTDSDVGVWYVDGYDSDDDELHLTRRISDTGIEGVWIAASRVTPSPNAAIEEHRRNPPQFRALPNSPLARFAGSLSGEVIAVLNAAFALPKDRTLEQQLALAVLMGDVAAANALVDRLIEARDAVAAR